MAISALALLVHLSLAAPLASFPVPADQSVQLGISLNLTHADEMAKLRAAQLNPRSPHFREWLTPAEFGARFGQSLEAYRTLSSWLRTGGLTVTEAPSRAFIVANGTAAQVERLLAIRFTPVEGETSSVHTFEGKPRFPSSLAPAVLNVSGLDTRFKYKHHIKSALGNIFGPQDLRAYYNLNPLFAGGWLGQGQKLVVLSTATPPGQGANPDAINYFLHNVSDVKTPFLTHVISNPGNDVDQQPGAGTEFDLDIEMQSISVPAADSITLVVSPASTVFTVGANDIVNNLPDITVASVSLGTCESLEAQQMPTEFAGLRNALIQGTMEGQTWFAASGDNGANDCGTGSATVDFPSIIPEMMAAGGSELRTPPWDSNNALTGYVQEVAWNDGNQGGAAGGGISKLYPQPDFQLGLAISDAGRSVPDFALMAGLPGVAAMDSSPPGSFSQPVEGTSIASPLSAGMFALVASRVGCRLGDVHAALYALGNAQFDGGAAVFRDITSGDLSSGGAIGPAAGPGFDSATGWGSFDVAALANAWPACPTTLPDGGTITLADGGAVSPNDAGAPYEACSLLCTAGMTCTTLPGGPSTCTALCDPADAGSCGPGQVCNTSTIYATATKGSCVAGCASDLDCAATPGQVCSLCSQACIASGSPNGHIGDACTSNAQCPSGATCQNQMFLPNGYCTQNCTEGQTGGTCSCPGGSECAVLARNLMATSVCLRQCTTTADCGRAEYVCQPETHGSACLPKCQFFSFGGQTFDTCQIYDTNKTCDAPSGICGGGTVVVPDAGTPDAGVPDAGPIDDTIIIPAVDGGLGPAGKSGCGCDETGPAPFALALLAVLGLKRSRRR